ncbi:MAG: CBS domain-containing protein, partial [Bacteroidales bacterium]|nr:CBS domain-containing protein [Bacteroidales bacterium]
MKAVLVVLRPAAIQTSQSGFTPEAPLLKDIGTGFFSFTYGRKSRFINATQPVGEMLGFSNIQQLHSLNLDTFFVNPSQLKAIRAALAIKEEIHGREVLLRHRSGDEFSALISMMVVESASGEKWCEGTIEYLASASSRYTSPPMDLDKYSASYIMETPVTTVMNQPLVCHENMTVNSLITEIKTNNAEVAIVINSDGDPLGIIDAKTVGLRLAEGGSPETEIFRWMSSPPYYIHHTATVGEAFGMIQNSLRKCLVVTAEGGKAAGVITNDNLSKAFATTPALIFSEIAAAGTKTILRSLFLKSRKTAISMILGHADPYSVSLFLSAVADAICQRTLTLCLEEAGEPPCSFAFIQTGSAGRREQTLSTDQDNAIIFENCEGEKLKKAQSWFMALGKRVNEMLAETGYRLCKGGNMAGNPKWCQPVDRWKKYFSDWIKT